MKASNNIINRIIGLDMHPDVFAAAALENKDAGSAKVIWVHDRQATAHLENGPLSTYKSETFSCLKPREIALR